MNRTAFILSVALTAFALLLIGGVVTAVRDTQAKVAVTPAPTVETVAEPTVVDPAVQPALAEREQAYQNLIAEANSRLDQLQKANQSLQAQLNAIQSAPPTPTAPTATAPAPAPTTVTPQEAAQIAARYLNRTDLYSVESSQYNGASAYLVTFSSGDIVYVGTDGQVLAVQRAKGQIAMNGGGGGGGGEHEKGEHEHEHEGDD